MLNMVVFQGRLAVAPELVDVGETKKTTLRIGSGRKFKKNGETVEVTTWMDAICWGQLAEKSAEFLVKGQEVTVIGRIDVESWEKDGVKKYATRIHAEQVDFGAKPGAGKSGDTEKTIDKALVTKCLDSFSMLTESGISKDDAIKAILDKMVK